MIIGIEGVSCTGKTTLAAGLSERLGWQPVGCYFHVAVDPSALGRPIAESEAEQLTALRAHLQVESQRHEFARVATSRDGGVILDRTVNTLLAHVRAIGELQGLDAYGTARGLILDAINGGAATVPDLTLLLIGEPAVLAQRATVRPDLPAIYYAPTFTEYFNAHFDDPIGPRCVPLDATAKPDEVLDAALRHIARAREA